MAFFYAPFIFHVAIVVKLGRLKVRFIEEAAYFHFMSGNNFYCFAKMQLIRIIDPAAAACVWQTHFCHKIGKFWQVVSQDTFR